MPGPLRTPNLKVTGIDVHVAKFEIWGPVGSGGFRVSALSRVSIGQPVEMVKLKP